MQSNCNFHTFLVIMQKQYSHFRKQYGSEYFIKLKIYSLCDPETLLLVIYLIEIKMYRIFQTIRCTFSLQTWEENGGVSYSSNVAYLACWQWGAAVDWGHRRQEQDQIFSSKFFFLFSSSKTQVRLMVWCVIQSEKYGISTQRFVHECSQQQYS